MLFTLLGISAVYGLIYFWLSHKKKEKLLTKFLGDTVFAFMAILGNIALVNILLPYIAKNGFLLKYMGIPTLKMLAYHPELFVASSVAFLFVCVVMGEAVDVSQKKNSWLDFVGNISVRVYGIGYAVILSCVALASYQSLMWAVALLRMLGML